MQLKIFFQKHKKIIYYAIFILYAIINFILMVLHEPWRDETHAWLMAKELSIKDLFIESKFDGHPILWHLLLMPFAKLNFPFITLNIISYILLLISTWLFLFKTKLPLGIKIFAIFTIPFTYTYSAIARNYSCIILLLVIIGIYYPKRQENPIIYSILICLLIHTHSLAWGIVAGLTITFHFHEIILYFKNKQNPKIKSIVIGLILIIFNTLIVVVELYGTTNVNYASSPDNYLYGIVKLIVCLLFVLFLYTILIFKKHYKEFIILTIAFAFQIFIYWNVYSSILFQRRILFYAIFLFYLILISQEVSFDIEHFILCMSFIFITLSTGILSVFFETTIKDIRYPYTYSQEMAEYINNNVPKNSTILVDTSVMAQAIIPYLDDGYTLYDITYQEYVTCANVAYEEDKIADALSNLDSYRGQYLIICNDFCELDNCEVLYKSKGIPPVSEIKTEYFTLYFIPY